MEVGAKELCFFSPDGRIRVAVAAAVAKAGGATSSPWSHFQWGDGRLKTYVESRWMVE